MSPNFSQPSWSSKMRSSASCDQFFFERKDSGSAEIWTVHGIDISLAKKQCIINLDFPERAGDIPKPQRYLLKANRSCEVTLIWRRILLNLSGMLNVLLVQELVAAPPGLLVRDTTSPSWKEFPKSKAQPGTCTLTFRSSRSVPPMPPLFPNQVPLGLPTSNQRSIGRLGTLSSTRRMPEV